MLNRKPSRQFLYAVADNVAWHRRVRGLTQRSLARQTGFTKSFISNVECGIANVTLATLEVLAEGLGCTESELIQRKPTSEQAGALKKRARNHPRGRRKNV